jgi:hypothetical protein
VPTSRSHRCDPERSVQYLQPAKVVEVHEAGEERLRRIALW